MTISRNFSILAEGVNSSGVLTAANGGTGVTTSTGTGSVVLSASPTLTGTLIVPTITSAASTALTIQSAGTTALTIDTSQNVTAVGTVAMASSFKRNRIINGNMVVDQRNAGASVATTAINSNIYTVDRWCCYVSVASKFTVQQNAGAITPPTGFANYLGMTSTSAYSVAAGDNFSMRQLIEGFNVADLNWGTANAKTITLSFWAYSSLTGNFGGAICNNAGSRSYPFSYSIPSANTWTYITITVTGDTGGAGTWLTTNGVGIYVLMSMGTGTTYSGTAGAWAGTFYNSATGAVSVVGTSGATFYITGVQLEVGTKATPYEMQIYSDQLAQCQRYYQISTSNFRTYASAFAYFGISYITMPMRTTPTAAFTAPASASLNISGTPVITPYDAATMTLFTYLANSAGDTYYVRTFSLSAEL